MQSDNSLLSIIHSLMKWKKTIIYTTATAFVLSFFISFLVPVYYQAQTVFFAANESLASPTPVGGSDKDYFIYGTDNDRDRLLSVSQSTEVVNFLIDSFKLFEHYEIDPKSKKGPHRIREKLEKLYKVKKNQFGGIEMTVEDTEPELAAKMANGARDKVSSTVQAMIKDSQKKMLDNFDNKIKEKEVLIKVTDDSLQVLRGEYEIYDTKSQGALFAKLLTNTNSGITDLKGKINLAKTTYSLRDSVAKWKANLAGLESKKETLMTDLSQFNSGIAEVKQVELELARYTDQISFDKERYNQLKASYDAPFTALHVIEQAYPPVVKSRPKKSIIILASTFLTALLLILGIVILETYRKIPWDQVMKGE